MKLVVHDGRADDVRHDTFNPGNFECGRVARVLPLPDACAECGSFSISLSGIGTETSSYSHLHMFTLVFGIAYGEPPAEQTSGVPE